MLESEFLNSKERDPDNGNFFSDFGL